MAAACTAADDDDATGDPRPADLWPVPAGFTLKDVRPIDRSAPAGSVAADVVVLASSDPTDPRFVELTVFEFDDPEAAQAVESLPGVSTIVEPNYLSAGVVTAFLPAATVPGDQRSAHRLMAIGPSVDSVVWAQPDDDRILVGGAGVIQPWQLERIAAELGRGSLDDIDPAVLDGMVVLVDEPLGSGVMVELTSVHGTTTIETYDQVGSDWFTYLARESLAAGLIPDLDLAGELALQPSSDFGPNGDALDPARLLRWHDGRLTIVTFPPTIDDGLLTELAAAAATWDIDELLAAWSGAVIPDDEGQADASVPGAVEANDRPIPTADDVARLRRFVEGMRGIVVDAAIEFEIVDEVLVDDVDGVFVTPTLWLVMSALGLVDPDQTREGADQARIDQVRGRPGVVVPQATLTETEIVLVHEITHIIDEELMIVPSPSGELVDPGQALVEGNAHRVAMAYLDTLPVDRRAEMPPFPAIFPPGPDDRLSDAMREVLEFPYDEGRLFVTALAADGGEAAVDRAFRRPPTSTEQILYPDAYLRGDDPVIVALPPADGNEAVIDEGTLGAYLLTLTVEAHDPAAADALVAWAGDRYRLVRDEGRLCLLARIVLDSGDDASLLAGGLALAGLAVTVDGSTVDLEACAAGSS